MAIAVEFDYADVLPTVRRSHPQASQEDAEDAVSVAVCELMAKGTPLTGANVVTRARSRLIDARKRFNARHASLDAYLESDVDNAPHELAIEEVDFDGHVELREVADAPILRMRLAAVEAGGSSALQPRGTAKRGCKYSDEVVAKVRRLRTQGMPYRAIAERVGIPLRTVESWGRGKKRRMGSMPGWSQALIVTAILDFQRREGRRPTDVDCRHDRSLPTAQTAANHFGPNGWSRALEAAGIPREQQGRARYWTDERVEAAIRDFGIREGRMPVWKDWGRGRMPSKVGLHKHYGTESAEKVLAKIKANRVQPNTP